MAIRRCDINLPGPDWIEFPKIRKEVEIGVYRGEELLETISPDKLNGYLWTCRNCGFAIGVRKEGATRYHLRGKIKNTLIGVINSYSSEVKRIVIVERKGSCCSTARLEN